MKINLEVIRVERESTSNTDVVTCKTAGVPPMYNSWGIIPEMKIGRKAGMTKTGDTIQIELLTEEGFKS